MLRSVAADIAPNVNAFVNCRVVVRAYGNN